MRDHGPFPVIFDDILMAFDNSRALAALKCLVELAAQTQVFLFTHHDHVRELAIQSQYRDRIAVIEMPSLPGTAATL
jgi:chromosome segregation protein